MTRVDATDLLRRGRNLSDTAFVDFVFEQILLRSRDPGEELGVVQALLSGDRSRIGMILRMRSSAEACSRGADVRVHWSALLESGAQFVEDCYQGLLGRSADSGGLNNYNYRLESGAMTRAQLILGLSQSDEVAHSGGRLEGLEQLRDAVVVPLVHIVIADRGWIQERQAREIERRCLYVTVGQKPSNAPLHYYMPHTAVPAGLPGPSGAFFTHIEENPAAHKQFADAARAADFAVYMSEPYGDVVKQYASRAIRVEPGLDLEQLPLAPIRIGVIGRTYPSRRKGEDLIRRVMDVPGIEWVFTGNGWPSPPVRVSDNELGAFYAGLDYVLIASLYEGGPMSVIEALACGKPVIAPPVGFVPEFEHIEFPIGDDRALRNILLSLVAERRARRDKVAHITWDRWAEVHDREFRAALQRHDKWPNRLSADPSLPRVMMMLHKPEGVGRLGGPSRRASRTALELAKSGLSVTVGHMEWPDLSQTDVLHVFNVWEPDSALSLIRQGKSSRIPVVFSPIFLDLSTEPLAQALPEAFVGATSFAEIDSRLSKMIADVRAADRSRRERIEDFSPGFLEKVGQMIALCDHVIFLSAHERDLLAELGIRPPRHSIVVNGVDTELFGQADGALFKRTFGVSNYLLNIGHIEARKNQMLLAHACRDAGRPLLLIGGGGDSIYGRQMKAIAPPWAHIMGRIDDDGLLSSAIAGAAAFVLPSFAEGAPLAALEAGAAGVPLVLSNASGEREYFGAMAEYCDPTDPASIAEAVQRAIKADSPDDRNMRREFVAERYGWAASASGTIKAYKASIQAHLLETSGL